MTNVTINDDQENTARPSITIEDYLSLIFVLERDHEPIVGTHLADLLGVTPPTVTNTLKRMVRDGLIIMSKNDTHLTKTGMQSARTVMRRHMLTEWMMAGMLPWSRLHSEAHNLEHAISTMAESALLEKLNHPQTCPHGNPLPGFESAVTGWIPLVEIPAGETVIIRRVHELAEQNTSLLAFLEGKNIMPGVQAAVVEVLPFNQTVSLDVQGQPVILGYATARYIFVERGIAGK